MERGEGLKKEGEGGGAEWDWESKRLKSRWRPLLGLLDLAVQVTVERGW